MVAQGRRKRQRRIVFETRWVDVDQPYTRVVGLVVEAAGDATLAGVMENHDVPPDVLTSVIHWLRKGGRLDAIDDLVDFRRVALEGHTYCVNDGCEFVGLPKDFKVCPQCKTARYCGAACQKRIGLRVGTGKGVAPHLTSSKSE